MKHLKRRAIPALLALTLLLGAGAALASGGKNDPLVTLSYLEETVLDDILHQVERQTEDYQEELEDTFSQQIDDYATEMEDLIDSVEMGGSDTYELVTLTSHQTMALDVGCELMLRVGSAKVNAATSPALIDIATAGTIDNGASLEKNHLYMATIPDRTLTPTAATVKLLVRGGYTLSDLQADDAGQSDEEVGMPDIGSI